MLDYLRRRSTPPDDLLGIIAHVRTRWRLKLALRGALYVLATVFVLFLVAAYGMETVKFTSTSIIASRVLLGVALLASIFWFLVRPLRRQVSDEQVALYLEEHEPALQELVVSGLQLERQGALDPFAQRTIERALPRLERRIVHVQVAGLHGAREVAVLASRRGKRQGE